MIPRPTGEVDTAVIPHEVRQAICDQIHRYAFYSDTKQYHELPSLFTEDGVFDETCLGFPMMRGKVELTRIFSVPSGKYIYFVHFISNILITYYDGATARTTSYLRGEGMLSTGAMPRVLGYYDDVFVRQGGEWLIGERRLIPFAPPSGFSASS